MWSNLLAGILVGVALIICLLAWGEKAYGGNAAGCLLALAAILVTLAIIVFL